MSSSGLKAESGLLLGFFLPGDGLFFTAGFLAPAGITLAGYFLGNIVPNVDEYVPVNRR